MKYNVQKDSVFFAYLISITGILTYSIHFSKVQEYLGVVLVYSLLALALLFRGQISVSVDIHIPLIGILSAILLFSVVLTPRTGVAVRSLAYITFFVSNIIVVPALISQRYFFHSLAISSAVIVVVALPGTVLSDYTIFGIEMELNSIRQTYPGLPYFQPISGLLENQNIVGYFAAIGTIWSFAWSEYYPRYHGLWMLLGIGVFLTGSWAAILATFSGIVVVGLGRMDIQYARWGAVVSLGGVIVLVLMLTNLVPAIPPADQIEFGARTSIWTQAYEMIKAKPLFGYGPGYAYIQLQEFLPPGLKNIPFDNSFIRVFAMLGIGGFLTYLALFVAALKRARSSPVLLGLLCSAIILQLFQNHTMFGLEGRSTVTAIIVGYALTATTGFVTPDKTSSTN